MTPGRFPPDWCPNRFLLPELIAIRTVRPEPRERQAAIQAAMLAVGAQVLPLSPSVVLGYVVTFGGGSTSQRKDVQPDGSVEQQSRFGNFGGRQDVDAVVYWTLRNFG